MRRKPTEVDADRLAKQPAWVRQLVADLARERDDALADARAARLATNPDATDTVIDPYGEPPIGLPNGADVRFKLGGRGRHYIDCRVRNGQLVVQAGDFLRIEPAASNMVYVSVGADA